MSEELLDQLEEYEIEVEHQIEDFIEKIAGRIDNEFSSFDPYHPAILGKESGKKLYNFIREVEPEIMVETGVCNGFSSSVILKAMEDNEQGELYSVDFPVNIDDLESDDEKSGAVIPPGKNSGWSVPDKLRDRWTLIEGDTYDETPKLLTELSSEVDIFLHDSGHSYETMMFEFSLAWRNLKDGGFLLADNIDFSDAFVDFSKAKDLRKRRLGDMGLLVKRNEE